MKLLLSLLFLTVLLPLCAIEGQVVVTLSKNIEDQWIELLPIRPPVVNTVSAVVRGQPFQVRIFFRNPVLAGETADVAASVRITGPDGRIYHETKEDVTLCRAVRTNSRNLFLSPFHLAIQFEEQDPSGIYRINVLLKDRNSGETSPLQTAIQLTDRLPQRATVPWPKMLKEYYRAQHPEQILPAFRDMLKSLDGKKQTDKFNPIPRTAPFYFLLRDNPQMWEEFFRLTDTLPHRQKLYAAGIINSLGPDAVKQASGIAGPEMKTLLNRRAANLFEIPKVTLPLHLDVLWSEFFIRGTAEPLKKIVGSLDLLRGNMTPEQFKKIPNPTKQDRDNLLKTLIGRAALWSLSANARQHKLVLFYLEGFFLHRKTGSDFSRAAVGLILKKIIEEQEKNTGKAPAQLAVQPQQKTP